MTHTTVRPLVAATYDLAVGHDIADGKASVVRPMADNVAMWPGGSIFSSADDLSRFVRAFMTDGTIDGCQVLSPMVVEQLPRPHTALPGGGAEYGYGLMTYEAGGVRVVTHGGASRGYGSTIQMVPSRQFAIVVVTNSSGETLAKSRRRAMELVLALKPEPSEAPGPQSSPATAEELADYVGRYMHAPRQWDVSVSDGTLVLRFEQQVHRLTKVGERTFASDLPSGGQFVFVPGADGRTEHLFMGLYAARKDPRRGQAVTTCARRVSAAPLGRRSGVPASGLPARPA